MLGDIAQQIKEVAGDQVSNVHTALLGKVTAFDPGKCEATVQPYGSFAMSDGATAPYPAITQVPVVIPYCTGAGVGIGLPVKAGDDVLLIIPEVDIATWRTGSASNGSMRFDISNAVCIPGPLKKSPLMQKAVSSGGAVIGTAGCNIVVTAGGVTINGNVTVNGDVTAGGISLKNHTHTCPDGTTSAPQ